MPLDPKDLEIFLAHVRKQKESPFGGNRSPLCPVCGANSWTAEGPAVLVPYVDGALVLGGTAIPMMLLVCLQCWYTQQFAWAPIKQAAEAAAKPGGGEGG